MNEQELLVFLRKAKIRASLDYKVVFVQQDLQGKPTALKGYVIEQDGTNAVEVEVYWSMDGKALGEAAFKYDLVITDAIDYSGGNQASPVDDNPNPPQNYS